MRFPENSFDLSELRLPDRGDGSGAFDGVRLPKKPLLSVEQIREWVDAHRDAHGGKFPSVESGKIFNADGSDTGETWMALNQLFVRSVHGYPARGLSGLGYTSLRDFLDRNYPAARDNHLSIERLMEWVNAYRLSHDGRFPTSHSGAVFNPDGSEAGESWRGIDALFRTGMQGSPARGLRGCGYWSLAEFLDKMFPNERQPKR